MKEFKETLQIREILLKGEDGSFAWLRRGPSFSRWVICRGWREERKKRYQEVFTLKLCHSDFKFKKCCFYTLLPTLPFLTHR